MTKIAIDLKDVIVRRGLRIRTLRLKKHVSVLEIAEYLGLNRTSYSRIESGKRDLKCQEILDIATFLNVHPNKIIGVEAPRLISDRLKRFAISEGFKPTEINPRLFNFAITVVQDLHI